MIQLQAVEGKVIISVDLESKNSHTFSDGTKIRLERQYNNLNRRETHPVNATVISGEGMNSGSQILIHPNMTHETYRIYDYAPLSGTIEGSDIKYYSIPEEQCYAWLDGDTWKPLKNFDFALRVYIPYVGLIDGIEPTLVKDVLYVTTGEFKGKVVHTLKSCDYEIIFQGSNGQEDRLIRFRHFPDQEHEREEVIAVDEYLTKKVNNKELIIGLSPLKAKTI
jgi:hypothetical protein